MGLLELFAGRPIDRFAKQVMDETRRREPAWRGRYLKAELTIVGDDGGTVYLGRTHTEFLEADTAEQSRIIADLAGLLSGEVGPDADWDSAKPPLRPVIKNLTHVLNEASSLAGKPVATVIRPLVGPLGVLAAVDSERTMTLVSSQMLSKWDVSFDEVLAIAKANLAGVSTGPGFKRWEEGFYVSDYGDFFDASRMLMPSIFEALPVKGAPVAIVVEPSGVVVAGSDEPEALNAMADFAEAAIDNGQRAIAYSALILRDGAWAVWDFDPEAYPTFERMRVKQAMWDAQEQKAALLDHFKATGQRQKIGDVMVHEHDGRPKTFTQWREGALVPKADWVAFPGPKGDGVTTLAWDDVAAATGSLEQQAAYYPELYKIEIASDDVLVRLRQFPTPEGGFEADEGFINFTPQR